MLLGEYWLNSAKIPSGNQVGVRAAESLDSMEKLERSWLNSKQHNAQRPEKLMLGKLITKKAVTGNNILSSIYSMRIKMASFPPKSGSTTT